MSLRTIPDVSYELNEDEDLLTLEQGQIEPTTIVLHRMHVEHFAKLMNVGEAKKKAVPSELVDVLSELRDLSEELMYTLEAIPHFPPQSEPPEEVKMANHLVKVADRACSILGIETGNVPLLMDSELASIISGNSKEITNE